MASTARGGFAQPGKNNGADPRALVADSPILICLLGEFHVLKAGLPVRISYGSKTEKLLCQLALAHEHVVARQVLLDALWAQSDPALAGSSLNSLVYSLNKLLADKPQHTAPIVCMDGVCSLSPQAGIRVDVEIFEHLVVDGERHAHAGDHQTATSLYQHACELYRGDLQVGADVPAVIERERLRAMYLTALAYLADQCFAASDYTACRDYATRLLARDPCREDAHRLVMRCHVRLGERAQALRQYRVCEKILRAEFDAAPESSTHALFDLIRLDPDRV